jgi:hypothetical protein
VTTRALLAVRREEAAELADAGVVDDERHVAGVRCRRGHVVGLGDIEPERLDAGLGDGRGSRAPA